MQQSVSVDEIATAVRRLYCALLDAECRALEGQCGPFPDRDARLAFVMRDPRCAWLSPLARLLTTIDLCERDAGFDGRPGGVQRETRWLLGEDEPADHVFRARISEWLAVDAAAAGAYDVLRRLVEPATADEPASEELHDRHVRAMHEEHGRGR